MEYLKFKWLLYGLCLLIRLTAWRSGRMRQKLLERDMVLVLGLKDGKGARTIRCRAGKVRSHKGADEDAVSKIIWVSPAVGSRIMLNVAKGRTKALMTAVVQKELLLEGDARGIRWFLDVVGLMNRIYSKG